jgi:hypothetical protein
VWQLNPTGALPLWFPISVDASSGVPFPSLGISASAVGASVFLFGGATYTGSTLNLLFQFVALKKKKEEEEEEAKRNRTRRKKCKEV